MRENRYAIWSRELHELTPEVMMLDPDHARRRIHAGVAEIHGSRPKPLPERRFFAIGSCFARGVENGLRAAGIEVASADDAPYLARPDLFRPNSGAWTGANSFLNRYNLPSMLQELRVLAEGFPADDPEWLLYENGQHWIDLHYSMALPQVDRASSLERRGIIAPHLAAGFRRANAFVLTLGLVEAWFDRESRAYLNVIPPPRVIGAAPGRFEFHFLDYDANLSALHAIHQLLCRAKGDEEFELIVTVSPIPPYRTITSQDVVVANTEAKAILRAVAGEAARSLPGVTYFPSYEIVMNSDRGLAWEADQRHVKPALTRKIVTRLLDGLAP
jgi:hypothetical protein